MVDLTVVVPVRNEAASIAELHRELFETLAAWGRSFEIIVVDDGSTDESFEILTRLQSADANLRVIRFRRNFGQTAAFAAGFDHARGRYIVTMDGDLQNDPADIPGMVAALERGADIVCGWRKERQDPFFSRRMPSTMANALISIVTAVRLHDYGCSLKAFRAEIVKPMKLYGEMHRFLPAIASEQTSNIDEMVVRHRPRKYGRRSRRPRSSDSEVFTHVLDPTAPDLRIDWGRHGTGGICHQRVARLRTSDRRDVAQSAWSAAAVWHLVDLYGSAAGDAGPFG